MYFMIKKEFFLPEEAKKPFHYYYVSWFGKHMKNASCFLNDIIPDDDWETVFKYCAEQGCIIRVRMDKIVRRLIWKNGKVQLIKGY